MDDLDVRVRATTDAFDRALDRSANVAGSFADAVRRRIGSLGDVFSSLGRAGVQLNQTVELIGRGMRAVESVVSSTIGTVAAQGDAYQDLSRRLQVSVEDLSRWGFAAKQAGVPLEDLGQAYRSMSRAIADGATAGSDANKILSEGLGLTSAQIRALQTLSPDQAMLQLGQAFDRTADSAQKTADMATVFGRGFQSVLAIIKEGPEELRKNIELAERLGLTWDAKTAAAGDRLGDAVGLLQGAFDGLRKRILGNTETLDPLSAAIETAALKVADFGKAIPQEQLDALRAAIGRATDAAIAFSTNGLSSIVRAAPGVLNALATMTDATNRFLGKWAEANYLKGSGLDVAIDALGDAYAHVATSADRAAAAQARAKLAARLEADPSARNALAQSVYEATPGVPTRRTQIRQAREMVGGYSPAPPPGLNYTPGPGQGSDLPMAPPTPTAPSTSAPRGVAPAYTRSTAAGDSAAKDAAAAAKKAADEAYAAYLRGKQLELDAARGNAEARLKIEQRYTAEVAAKYGEQSKQYQTQLHAQNEAEAAAVEERRKVKRIELHATREHALAELDLKKDADQRALDAGDLTHGEYLRRLQEYYDRRRDIIVNAERDEAALGPQTPIERAETAGRIQSAEGDQKAGTAEVGAQTELLSEEVLKGYEAAWDGMWSSIGNSASQSINGMILAQQRFGVAARNLSRQVLGNFVNMGVQMVTSFVANIGKMILAWVFGESLKTTATIIGTQTRRSVESAANRASILEYAIIAFGAAYQAAAAIPFVGWILGPIAGAVAFAAVMAMGAGIGSAEGGWGDVPADGTPAILHKREMVLPASIATTIRDMTNGYSGGRAVRSWTLQAPELGSPELSAMGAVLADRLQEGVDDDAVSEAGGGEVGGRNATVIHVHAMDAGSVAKFIKQPGVVTAFTRGLEAHARLQQRRP